MLPTIDDLMSLSAGERVEVAGWVPVETAVGGWAALNAQPRYAQSIPQPGLTEPSVRGTGLPDPAGPVVGWVNGPLSASEERMYRAGGESPSGNGWSGVAHRIGQLLEMYGVRDEFVIDSQGEQGYVERKEGSNE
jgi:hypothetical protein